MIRRYWLLLLTMVVVGCVGGVVSVVLDSPVYKARVMLEVQPISEAWLKNSIDSSNFDSNEVGIQTQIMLLRSGPFLRRVFDRLQSETVPVVPAGQDIFSKLRQRLRTGDEDPLQNVKRGLETALVTFDARPINRTRLIELTCDSTSPVIASQFVNTMANEFMEETLRGRMQTSQKTSEWLSAQIEETKAKVQETEERLHEFVQASGNLFASQETTLDDAKLNQLRAELARIQADRISKQTKYELTVKNPREALPEILEDSILRSYQQKVNDLRREKAALGTSYTDEHPKVRRLDAQIAVLQSNLQAELTGVTSRIRNDYEAARRQEETLAAAYTSQSQRVTAMAGKAAQYNSLKREVDTLRQMYQSLLMQSNQAGLMNSVPVNPVRLVEPSAPAPAPYKPRPPLNITFGAIFGLAVTAGIVFLREKLDQSVKSPGLTRSFLNTPELGVIPSAALELNSKGMLSRFRRKEPIQTLTSAFGSDGELSFWKGQSSMLAESFRGTLASLFLDDGAALPSVIMLTSAGSGEGKTTIAANLGIALAETGRRVLLIDADFRRPRLHDVFHVQNQERTLLDLLTEETPVADYAPESFGVSTSIAGLTLLTNRSARVNVSRLLYSPRLPEIIDRLRAIYDMVVIDAPPILNLADSRIIARMTDGVILVLRAGVTDRAQALQAYERICEDHVRLVGTILNDWSPSKAHLKQHYYYSHARNEQE